MAAVRLEDVVIERGRNFLKSASQLTQSVASGLDDETDPYQLPVRPSRAAILLKMQSLSRESPKLRKNREKLIRYKIIE
jgi:hypothetical protein